MSERVNPSFLLDDPFGVFLAATAGAFPDYRRLMRGKGPHLEINGPERFVRRFVDEHFDQQGGVLEGQRLRIVEEALGAPVLNGLAAVAAALIAIREEQWTQAAHLAERAFAADQHETFAQRLYLAAQERSASLRLAVDDWLEDRFCSNPFTDAEIIGSREVYSCCAAWLPAPLGSADSVDPAAWWVGDRATEIRRSILDGDFGYCSRLSCPRIANRTLPLRDEVVDPALRRAIDSRASEVPDAPDRLLLSYDTSCNLSCPSCRSSLLTLPQAESAQLDAFFDARLAPLAAQASRIKVTGSGDPFGSRHFRQVLRKVAALDGPAARLQIHTNGVLFDERAWTDLGLDGRLRSVWVSVDATEQETYGKLRREGDFERLMANLRFLGDQRSAGRFGELRLDFVVQSANFRQMPDFVRLARGIGADGVHFLMLRNWGTFTPSEYQRLAVCLAGHPEHDDLLDILCDPVFDAPDVDLGNLAPLRASALARSRRSRDPTPPVLVVLGCARTGSNYLLEALRAFPELMVLSEVFNPDGSFGLDYYPSKIWPALKAPDGGSYSGERDARLIARMRSNPTRALADLRGVAAGAGYTALVIKVFPDHLPQELLTETLIAEPFVQPIVLRRDLLSCFISISKARASSRWMRHDTTEATIAVDPVEALSWLRRTAGWYAEIGEAIASAGKTPLLLDYDRMTASPAEDLSDRLRSSLGRMGIRLEASPSICTTLSRQDRTPDPFDRVNNGADLRKALTEAGWLEGALVPPQLDRLVCWLT